MRIMQGHKSLVSVLSKYFIKRSSVINDYNIANKKSQAWHMGQLIAFLSNILIY